MILFFLIFKLYADEDEDDPEEMQRIKDFFAGKRIERVDDPINVPPMDHLPDPHRHHHPNHMEFEEKKREQINCTAPNTRNHWDNKCVCEENYFGDESTIMTIGCWKCEPECHTQGKCIHPGKCECDGGLLGDGINFCHPPIPIINLIHPPSENQYYPLNVIIDFKTNDNFFPFLGFCKFNNNETIIALILNSKSLSCLIPLNLIGNTKVSISFDGLNFSKESQFEVYPGIKKKIQINNQIINSQNNYLENILILISIFSSIIFIYILITIKKKKKVTSDIEENISLLNTNQKSNFYDKELPKKRDT